jgi:broad specificity phosphatase PhoE
MHQIIFL